MTRPTEQLLASLSQHRRIVVLTGAGISARSGIPTYRDASGNWLRNQPIQHSEFIQSAHRRQRYWGRSMAGWPGVRDAKPNNLHLALTRLEATGVIELIITQNVDRLHQRAGSRQVVDLHGRLDRVLCLDCGAGYQRDEIQCQLEQRNPQHSAYAAKIQPDGDADLNDDQVAGIFVVDCAVCGGLLMPDVVFFGGSIPRGRVDVCQQAIDRADALLVIGSSLQVYSGYRFCKQAYQRDLPIYIVNEGLTRADDLATLKINDNALDHFVDAVDRLCDIYQQEPACPTP